MDALALISRRQNLIFDTQIKGYSPDNSKVKVCASFNNYIYDLNNDKVNNSDSSNPLQPIIMCKIMNKKFETAYIECLKTNATILNVSNISFVNLD
jgi:hypothetical protein